MTGGQERAGLDENALVTDTVMPARQPSHSMAHRVKMKACVYTAWGLSRLNPERLEKTMSWLSTSAKPATYQESEAAVMAVVRGDARSAGWYGCLPRSIAACLLLRLDGKWPRWCVGVTTMRPFRAHAWIESNNQIVAELGAPSAYSPLITVDVDSTHHTR